MRVNQIRRFGWHDEAGLALFLIALLSLIPNPALAIGKNSVIQPVTVACFLLISFRANRTRQSTLAVWLMTSIPAMVTLAWYAMSGSYFSETAKICVPWILCTGQVMFSSGWNDRERALLLKGILTGILANTVVCVLQSVLIPMGVFPLASIYPSAVIQDAFALQSSAGNWGIRVWGLFLESSDMAGSIAFWVLLMIGIRLGLGGPEALVKVCRSVWGLVAQISGVVILLLSRSGQVLMFAPGLAIVVVAALIERRQRRLHQLRTLLLLVLVLSIATAAVIDVQDRMRIEEERSTVGIQSSWSGRASSIVQSLQLWWESTGWEFLFGLGFRGPDTVRAVSGMNVWSVVASSVLAFGLLGAVSWLALGAYVARSILRSNARLFGLALALNCFGTLMVTISSVSLLSPWMGIVLLAAWSEMFPRARRERPTYFVRGVGVGRRPRRLVA